MKTPHLLTHSLLALGVSLFSLSQAHAQISFDDGAVGDSNWSSAANWSTDTLPTTGDTITIGSAYTVNFDVGSQNLPSNATLIVDGTLTTNILRANGADITVSSTGLLTAPGNEFYDWNNATVTFQDGAQFTNATWENKGTNTFNFELGTTGFDTLAPSRFFVSGGAGAISNATYNADLGGASYIGGSQTLTLIDYASNNAGMNNTTFQTANLNIIDTGTNAARLYWDDATDAVKLSINETVTWTGAGGNNLLTNAANWDTPDGKAPIANDTLLINNGDTVAHANNLPGNTTINLVGSELTTDGPVIRLSDSTINVDAGSTLSGLFWDLDGASIVFEDGAQATMANWEQKDINSFTYQLGAYDFTTLTPDRFLIGNGSLTGDIANATYIADFSNFANWSLSNLGSNSITLMDFNIDGEGMNNAQFQSASFDYINMGANIENAAFAWDDSLEAIILTFDINAVPEPSSTALLGLGGLALALRRRR
jgi:hypothetical protein